MYLGRINVYSQFTWGSYTHMGCNPFPEITWIENEKGGY